MANRVENTDICYPRLLHLETGPVGDADDLAGLSAERQQRAQWVQNEISRPWNPRRDILARTY